MPPPCNTFTSTTHNSSTRWRWPSIPYPLYTSFARKSRQEKENYVLDKVEHTRTKEYASYIMEAITTDIPYKIGGNVINNGVIPNLPDDACVEVACLVNKRYPAVPSEAVAYSACRNEYCNDKCSAVDD